MSSTDGADVDAIKNMVAIAGAAWEADDAEGFLDTFTDDVVWMPPGEPDIVGKAACRSMVENILGETNFEQVATPSEEIVVAGDWAFHRFRVTWASTPRAGGETTQTEFRGFHVLQKQGDGSWKVARYIWNGSVA